ncbi:MAG: DUF3122 domain-containing protein [Xenococcaceae cyanobacterium MO_207.B15]|nr:DUF3122 domain-containing protein [Xenococcaceae cyanobacterium MO_207.B15]
MKKPSLLIILTILLFLNFSIFSYPAIAVLREHHQAPGILSYHAQYSIQDQQKRAWQVIVFPEDINQQNTNYYVRLVGFPGLADFIHPSSLEIITSEGNILIAPDVFAESAPAANVGQYDLTEIFSQLPTKGSVKLIFSLAKDALSYQDIALNIPSSILTEWWWLYKSSHTQ